VNLGAPTLPPMDARDAAWDAVHEALPARWTVGLPNYDPGLHAWSVTAHSLGGGGWRRRLPGAGDAETAIAVAARR